MHKTVAAAVDTVRELKDRLPPDPGCEVVVAPPFTALHALAKELAGCPVKLAAQNVHAENQGAFTGEISAPMLSEVGCTHVIVGHSERRELFGEDDEDVNRKLKAVLGARLTPIVCLGETIEQREAGATIERITDQLNRGLRGLDEAEARRLVVAYEPVWAIGTGRTAGPDDAQQAHAALRAQVRERFGEAVASAMRILYGGSARPDNAAGLLAEADVDGLLVGGASLAAESLASIVEAAEPRSSVGSENDSNGAAG
ncbi:MAG: triose-phosphate isomerase [Proteobacteria bacterium]|nr:triose-phosphate isomerase [Pseudomonadota bacterium]